MTLNVSHLKGGKCMWLSNIFDSIIGLVKWLIGAAVFVALFLLCLLLIPGIFDEIIVVLVAIPVAIANPPSLDGD